MEEKDQEKEPKPHGGGYDKNCTICKKLERAAIEDFLKARREKRWE